jgi:(+)-pinoresinol hydroxylase
MNIMRAALAALLALPLVTVALGEEQSSSWTTFTPRTQPSATPLVQRGEAAFQARCNLCHGRESKDVVSGFGGRMAGTEALEARYRGAKPAMLEERTDLTAEVVRFYVRNGAGIMPFFRKTEVSDADLDAIAAYLSRKNRKPANR